MERECLLHLYKKYKARELTPLEVREWHSLLRDPRAVQELEKIIDDDWDVLSLRQGDFMTNEQSEEVLRNIIGYEHSNRFSRIRMWYWAVSAAVILLFAGGAFYLQQLNDVLPGTNRAFLTLADGRKIELSTSKEGVQFDKNGISYIDGSLSNVPDLKDLTETVVLTTPRGGQYKVRLSDGSEVTINAASSLKYPIEFGTMDRREVELEGEAFFSVAKDVNKPFIVKTKGQNVQVMGTKFLVSAYLDERTEMTTLLEGVVQVSSGSKAIRLKPNEQALLQNGQLAQRTVLAEEEIAWVHDEFVFNDESLDHIMKKLRRWYQVEVLYEDEALASERFVGIVGRFEQIDKLLTMLESISGTVDFVREGKTIIVKKKRKK